VLTTTLPLSALHCSAIVDIIQFTFEVAMQKDLEGTATAIAYPMKGDQTPAEAVQAVRSELHYLFYEKGACVNRMLYLFIGRY
jgi:hypothetical protein